MSLRTLVALAASAVLTCATAAQETRPNILILLADDLGYGDLGCYGNEVIATPHLDRLASQGVRLTDCYAGSPVCSPARAALLTGRAPDRTGVYDWIPPHPGHDFVHLPRSEITVATLLRAQGYATSVTGKWHLNGRFNHPAQPTPGEHGFDHWFVTAANLNRMQGVDEFVRNGEPVPASEAYACQAVANEAIDWLRNGRPKDRPFFQCVWFHEPHEPLAAPLELVQRYSEHGGTKPVYYAAVTNLDAAVGRVLAALDELSLTDDTFVFFTSDNGPAQLERGYRSRSHGSGGPLRGYKWSLWEGGIRVPGLLRWPGHMTPGTVVEEPISGVDLLPTLCALTGITPPTDRALDGIDFSPALAQQPLRRTVPLHWHYYAPYAGPRAVLRQDHFVVTADWQAPGPRRGRIDRQRVRQIKAAQLSECSLYDLKSDLGQTRDVADRHPEVVAAMAHRLVTLHEEVQEEAPDWKPVPRQSPGQRPNVLLIVSEDNGPELGCYGDRSARTPHLDALAADGVRFARAFTTHSVCSPSRSSILTGLFPHQNGQIGLATHGFAMFRPFPNLPGILKDHGYRTGLIGKLHVNPEDAFPFDFRWNDSKFISFARRDVRKIAGVAGEFMQQSAPFFLQVSYPDAHFPLHRQRAGLPEQPLTGADVAPLPFVGIDNPRLRDDVADYYNCLSRLDTGVGLLLDTLERCGKTEDTVVIYLGDHGAQFSRGKATCYEAGLRIPLMVRWPGVSRAGHVAEQMVSVVDLLPSLLAGLKLPVPETLPGRSLLPLLEGEAPEWRQFLFAERTTDAAFFHFPQRSVRDDRYKLIVNLLQDRDDPIADAYARRHNVHFAAGTTPEELEHGSQRVQRAYATWRDGPAVELYDLRADPYELDNLADRPELAKTTGRLLAALRRWQAATSDPLADPALLQKLTEECDRVSRDLPGGRYPRGGEQTWGYLDYLAPVRRR